MKTSEDFRQQNRLSCVSFFFQAEDGIRDRTVTGVQTCALPICQLLRLTSPDLKQPSADQYNLGWSGQVSPRVSLDIDYVRSNGHDEIHRWRINTVRSEERRVGKECRSRWSRYHEKEKGSI